MSTWLRARSVLDRAVAAIALVPAAPVIALLAWRVRAGDHGPGFVRLERVGRHGRIFRMCKLRTMQSDQSNGRAGGAPITAVDDHRVTPFGRRVRKLRLDELPQLLHVVSGRMALFGPRPEAPELVETSSAEWRSVLRARPGIAGPTQLVVADWEATALRGDDPVARYRAEVLPVKLAIDDWYVRNATPWIDALVVLSLLQRVVLRRAHTAIERRVVRDLPAAAAATGTPAESVAA